MNIVSNGTIVQTESSFIEYFMTSNITADEIIEFWCETVNDVCFGGVDALPLSKTNFKKIPYTGCEQKHDSRKQRVAFYNTDEFHIIELGLLLMAILSIIEFIWWWPEILNMTGITPFFSNRGFLRSAGKTLLYLA